jgi:hypothetical protein
MKHSSTITNMVIMKIFKTIQQKLETVLELSSSQKWQDGGGGGDDDKEKNDNNN